MYAVPLASGLRLLLMLRRLADSLTVGIFVLPAGRLGDIYGSRRMLFIGYIWFGLASMVAGLTVFAKSPIFFDVMRAFQGIGPAILLPNSIAVLGRSEWRRLPSQHQG